MKIILFCLILFYSVTVYSQEVYTISVTAIGMANQKVELFEYYGDSNNSIDSVVADANSNFQFQFDEDTPVGVYQLRFGQKIKMDFIFNKEDIKFSLVIPNGQVNLMSFLQTVNILTSEENKLYYEFLRVINNDMTKAMLLNQLKMLYTSGSGNVIPPFIEQIESELNNITANQSLYVWQMINSSLGTYFSRLLRSQSDPFVDKSLPKEEQNAYLKLHYLDNIDFNDEEIIRSPVLPQKIWSYVMLYKNDQLDEMQRNEEIIKAVDFVISKAEINDVVRKFIIDMIVVKFEKSKFELAFTYFSENYALKEACSDEGLQSVAARNIELQEKIEIIKNLSIGKIAPEISMPFRRSAKVPDGTTTASVSNELLLSQIKADYTLVLFWASWCKHCVQLMPKLKTIYDEYTAKGFEVLAVSIDKEQSKWLKFLADGNYKWINYFEMKGWEGKILRDYNVWSTPRMYLLDKEKKIILKPATVEELQNSLKLFMPSKG